MHACMGWHSTAQANGLPYHYHSAMHAKININDQHLVNINVLYRALIYTKQIIVLCMHMHGATNQMGNHRYTKNAPLLWVVIK